MRRSPVFLGESQRRFRNSAHRPECSSSSRQPYIVWAQDRRMRHGADQNLVRLGVAKADTLDADLLVARAYERRCRGQHHKRWTAISAIGAIVASTATAIYRPPPIGDPQSFIALGTLLSSVTSGLLYVAMTRFAAKRTCLYGSRQRCRAAGAVWCHSYYGTLFGHSNRRV